MPAPALIWIRATHRALVWLRPGAGRAVRIDVGARPVTSFAVTHHVR